MQVLYMYYVISKTAFDAAIIICIYTWGIEA